MSGGYASSAEGKQCELLLNFAFRTTQKKFETKKIQFPKLKIVPFLLGDGKAFSFRPFAILLLQTTGYSVTEKELKIFT